MSSSERARCQGAETRLGQLWDIARATIAPMLYTAKCFWPGVTEDELRLAAARAGSEPTRSAQAVFRGALYLPGDELVLCLFESASRAR